jgi:uncharacterized membrane protein affecting hemolysin expression
MFNINSPLRNSIILYLLIIFIFILYHKNYFSNNQNQNQNQKLYVLPAVVIFSSVLSYYIFIMLNWITTPNISPSV